MDQELLFQQIAQELGAALVGFDKLRGGVSANVWRLDLDTGQVVFRQHTAGELADFKQIHQGRAVARKEFQLLQVLHQHGFPVAQPLYLDDANCCLITDFVAGVSTVDPAALAAALDRMADLLAQLHAFDVAYLDDVDLGPIENPFQRLRTCLPDAPSGQQLGSLLAGDTVAMPANAPVLLHGDYWPGNFLWHDEQLAALIDWEDASLGDPLVDLACARVELLTGFGEVAMEHFTARYLEQAGPVDTRSLPVWECYVSATALASMHLWGLPPDQEATRRATTLEFFTRAVDALT